MSLVYRSPRPNHSAAGCSLWSDPGGHPHQTTRSGKSHRRRQARPVSVVIPERTWDQFREAMLAARPDGNEEVLGFFFVERHRTSREDRYLVRDWVVPDAEDYEDQSASHLTLKQEVHLQLLATYLPRGLHLMHIHTHPGEYPPAFSMIDDRNERETAAALFALPGQSRLLSAVFNQSMTAGQVRIWSGKHRTSQPITLQIGWMPAPRASALPLESGNLFDRQRIFGAGVQDQLDQLSVSLIGCGGIGAPFAEQLARLGVHDWILVDDDRIEVTNLHRLPHTTAAMAERGVPKVDYVGGLIRRFWGDQARVRSLRQSITDERAQATVAEADLIVVATDNHASRLLAQQIAARTMRPLLCLGTFIGTEAESTSPRIFSRVTMPPLAGGWCLACGEVIDLHQAAQELADPAMRAELIARGYLDAVPAPAVYWVNTISAGLGVRLVHGALAGFVATDAGVDEISDLALDLGSVDPDSDLSESPVLRLAHDVGGCFVCDPFAP